MPKFTFICEHDDVDGSAAKTTLEFEKEFLYDVVEEFERFLRGSGFFFEGQLEFVNDAVDKIDNNDFTIKYPPEDHYSPDETFFVNEDNMNQSFTVGSSDSAVWPFPHTATQASTVTGSRNEDILHVSV